MAFQLSPGVNVSEIDLTTIVPAVGTTEGAYVGRFQWGPINEITTIGNEIELASTFGKPDANTFIDFFTAANFLSYARNLKLVRAANTSVAKNATSGNAGLLIKTKDQYVTEYLDLSAVDSFGAFAAKYAGELGNSLKVSVYANNTTNSASWNSTTWQYAEEFDGPPTTSTYASNVNGARDEMHVIVIDEKGAFSGVANTVLEKFAFVSKASDAKNDDGSSNYYVNVINDRSQYIYIINHPTVANSANISSIAITTSSAYDANFSGFITFSGGVGTGANASFQANAGGYIVAANVTINNRGTGYNLSDVVTGTITGGNGSSTITVTLQNVPETNANWGSQAANTTFAQSSLFYTASLFNGVSGDVSDANRVTAYDLFSNSDEVDVSLIMTGAANTAVAQHAIDLAIARKDCVAFVSPQFSDVVNQAGLEANNVIDRRNTIGRSTSYAVMDSSWKYQFDKYNNVYRWVPLNGDIAGLCVRTDFERDPWYSPAGFNRGQLRNVVKLSYNPDKADRDDLYKNGINPVVTFRGEGTILYGDKTMQAKPSAFDRINVRRLFIVLEKAIARAAKYSLFEFNDAFTRAQFVALVEPFLRDVQGRRGIFDFRVVCDETNNTPEVIDRNEFIGDIYIKPARSINFIQLNFIAVRTGVSFDEIVGRF